LFPSTDEEKLKATELIKSGDAASGFDVQQGMEDNPNRSRMRERYRIKAMVRDFSVLFFEEDQIIKEQDYNTQLEAVSAGKEWVRGGYPRRYVVSSRGVVVARG
jgi:hypothetical protein